MENKTLEELRSSQTDLYAFWGAFETLFGSNLVK